MHFGRGILILHSAEFQVDQVDHCSDSKWATPASNLGFWNHLCFQLETYRYIYVGVVSMAAVINYQIFSGLNNTHLFFHSSKGQKSESSFSGVKSGHKQGYTPSRSFREELFFA